MSSEEQISGKVKNYNKDSEEGFIRVDNKEFYFNSSDLLDNYFPREGDLISFVPDLDNVEKPRARFVCPMAKTNNSQKLSSKHSAPPCPHCGSTKGSKYGWTDGNGCKHNVCLSCGEEHTYGAIKSINDEIEKEIEIAIKESEKARKKEKIFLCVWGLLTIITSCTIVFCFARKTPNIFVLVSGSALFSLFVLFIIILIYKIIKIIVNVISRAVQFFKK